MVGSGGSAGANGAPIEARSPRARRILSWLGLLALLGAAVVGSDAFGVRERLLGSALPDPVPPVAARSAEAAAGRTAAGRTALRSTPWWQDVVVLDGTGATTPSPFTIDRSTIQWRVKGTCTSGRLVVRLAGDAAPLLDAACTEGGTAFAATTGASRLEVGADGPWRLEVAQRIDTPLVEPPLPSMSAAGSKALATGTFYKIDRSGAGSVTIFDQADGRYTVRLEDFFVTPDSQLQLRLSPLEAPDTTQEYLSDRSQLLAVLDVTAGSLNYTAPVGVDPTAFRSLVVWDPSAKSAYAAARLGPPA